MKLNKPYDAEALLAAGKELGIENLEIVGKQVVNLVADWLVASMQLSSEGLVGKLDDLAIPAVNSVRSLAISKLDLLSAPKAEEAKAE